MIKQNMYNIQICLVCFLRFRVVDPTHPDHEGLGGAPVFASQLNIEAEGFVAVGDRVYASY